VISRHDRRRILAASVVTALTLPLLIRENLDRPEGPAAPAAIGAVGGAAVADLSTGSGGRTATTVPVAEALSSSGVALDQGPIAPVAGAAPAPLPTESTVPALPGRAREGKAGFRIYDYRDRWGDRPCASADLPVGTEVGVTNLNNGRTTTCLVARNATPAELGKDRIIELDSEIFAEIADPAVGVIPVRVTW
jgi:hypothetical protein